MLICNDAPALFKLLHIEKTFEEVLAVHTQSLEKNLKVRHFGEDCLKTKQLSSCSEPVLEVGTYLLQSQAACMVHTSVDRGL